MRTHLQRAAKVTSCGPRTIHVHVCDLRMVHASDVRLFTQCLTNVARMSRKCHTPEVRHIIAYLSYANGAQHTYLFLSHFVWPLEIATK
jgi:hypothetical protein